MLVVRGLGSLRSPRPDLVAVTHVDEHPHEGGGEITSLTIELTGGVTFTLEPGLECLGIAALPASVPQAEAWFREALMALGG